MNMLFKHNHSYPSRSIDETFCALHVCAQVSNISLHCKQMVINLIYTETVTQGPVQLHQRCIGMSMHFDRSPDAYIYIYMDMGVKMQLSAFDDESIKWQALIRDPTPRYENHLYHSHLVSYLSRCWRWNEIYILCPARNWRIFINTFMEKRRRRRKKKSNGGKWLFGSKTYQGI